MNTSKTCKNGHPLRPDSNHDVFACDYCMEKGMGPRFSCAGCKYNLHRECALAETVRTHTFIRGIFTLSNSKSKTVKVCAACGNVIQGIGYNCDASEHSLHPCCAYLPKKIESDDGGLFLDDKIMSECELCDRDDPGWCYRTKKKDNYSHISCMKEETLTCFQNQNFSNALKDRLEDVAYDEAKRSQKSKTECFQNQNFSNALKDRLEDVAYDEAKRSQKLKTEWELASEDVKLIRDNSFNVQVHDKAESSRNSSRKSNKKTKKNKSFWRWAGYAVTYVVVGTTGFDPSPGLLLLEG